MIKYVISRSNTKRAYQLEEDPTCWHSEDHFSAVDSYRPYYSNAGCAITRRWDTEFTCKSGRHATVKWVEYKDKNGKLREAVAQVIWANK